MDACPICGGRIIGDGYTVVRHCENCEEISSYEPDADIVFCKEKQKLKNCPFCGSKAIIIYDEKEHNFQIVGCSNQKSMFCPRPSTVAYKNTEGVYDYKWWNRREEKNDLDSL